MTQSNNILQELRELESSLAGQPVQNIFTVPAGYFEDFAGQMLNRIKALEAGNASEELSYLSPVLNSVSKQTPYKVPAGYFESVDARLVLIMQEQSTVSAAEELESISPLLSSIGKKMPYAVPENYFENLTNTNESHANQGHANVVSITRRKWFRYAAAAVITGIIALGALLYFNIKNKVDPNKDPEKWVAKNTKKIDPKAMDAFVQMADENLVVATTPVKPEEVKELMKDVSDKELKDFLDEIPESASSSSDEDVMMN